MLFNSVEFIFAFLPITLALFWVKLRLGNRPAAISLLAASLFFYGWWDPRFIILVVSQITITWLLARAYERNQFRNVSFREFSKNQPFSLEGVTHASVGFSALLSVLCG